MDELNKKEEINVLNHTTDNSEFEKNADLSMVLGILSLVFGGIPILNVVLAIIAIIKANDIPKEHRNGKAIAGMVMGIISIVLSVVSVIILIILVLALGIFAFNNAARVVDDHLSNSILEGYYEEYDLEEQNIINFEEDILDENEEKIEDDLAEEDFEELNE